MPMVGEYRFLAQERVIFRPAGFAEAVADETARRGSVAHFFGGEQNTEPSRPMSSRGSRMGLVTRLWGCLMRRSPMCRERQCWPSQTRCERPLA